MANRLHNVPCGKCLPCITNRIDGWKFRILHEYRKEAVTASFLTLTYDEENVPYDNDGQMILHKSDYQNFVHRARKYMQRKHSKLNYPPIKYFACGEYGSKNHRPHYHAIFLNSTIDTIEASWDKGSIHFGEVNENSVAYTLKYMCKSILNPFDDTETRPKEFQLMSKGIGATYINENMSTWHKSDLENRYYIPDRNGGKVPLPRFYKNKIYTDNERKLIGEYAQENPRYRTYTEEERLLYIIDGQRKLRNNRLVESL